MLEEMRSGSRGPEPGSDLADLGDLVRRARAGDEQAWNEIVARFSPMVTSRVRAVGLPPCMVDDAIQMTWLRLATSLGSIRQPDRLGSWLWAAARSAAVDLIRREGRVEVSDRLDEWEHPDEGIEAGLVAADTAAAVRSAVGGLSDRQRALVELRFLDGGPTSYAQIAEQLDMRVGAIGPTLGRAMHRMRHHPNIARLR